MRIAIVGIGTESSTFSLDVTDRSRFREHRGRDLLASYDLETRFDQGLLDGVEFVPILVATALPGGEVEPSAFDDLQFEILNGLKELGPFNGIYFDLHGATKVRGREAAEEGFVRSVRDLVGPDVVFSAAMDPHGNFSRQLAGLLDLAASHRHAPHIDHRLTQDRAITNLVKALRIGTLPLKAWVRLPVLLPGEHTSTVVEPGATVFGRILPAIEKYGVLDANIWIGFAWADEARNAAAVLVTGYEEDAVKACAAELAHAYWDAREEFVIVSKHFGAWDDGLDYVLTSPPTPTYISDSGDNITAGSSGDITYALEATLARNDVLVSRKRFLFAGLVDKPSVLAAIEVGVGGTLTRSIGADIDSRYGSPVPGPWKVDRLIDGLFGEGIVGALVTDGKVWVTVQSFRTQFVSLDDPSLPEQNLPGLAPINVTEFDVVVVKNGYLFPSQAAISRSAFIALTPGGADLDFTRLTFTKLSRPMFPFDRDFEADLTPILI